MRLAWTPAVVMILLVTGFDRGVEAQTDDYIAPGGVATLDAGAYAEFPDGPSAREWLLGFNRGLQAVCGPIADPQAARRSAGLNRIEAEVNVGRYTLAGGSPAREGYADGRAYAAAAGCEGARAGATGALMVAMAHGARPCPDPSDRIAFRRLLSPAFRSRAGIDDRGLTASETDLVQDLVSGIEGHLRTRQIGAVDPDDFHDFALEVAAVLATSAVPDSLLNRMRGTDAEGRPIVGLHLLASYNAALLDEMPSTNPFQSADEAFEVEFERWVEGLWEDTMGRIETMVVGGPPRESATCRFRRTAMVMGKIRDVLPPELGQVFSFRESRWVAPAAEASGSLRVRFVDPTGRPMGGLEVWIDDDAGSNRLTPILETGDDGVVHFDGLPAGPVSIHRLSTHWYDPALGEVTSEWRTRGVGEGVLGATVPARATHEVELTLHCAPRSYADDVCPEGSQLTAPQPDSAPPSPQTGSAFVPYTEAPTLLNREEVLAALDREYPSELKAAGVGGVATVQVVVAENGEVGGTRLSGTSGHRLLDEAALRIADVLRFSPAMNRGQPVQTRYDVPITFDPGGDERRMKMGWVTRSPDRQGTEPGDPARRTIASPWGMGWTSVPG